MDWISANLLLPVGGLFIAVFIGWIYGRKKVEEEISMGGHISKTLLSVFMFLVKFIAPIAISIVLLNKVGLLNFG
jgi:NSS family neurotransmitter:Na+ symporter